MNTYIKFAPNVFLAKCTEKHEKSEIIPVTTKYGKENECIVFNLIGQKDGYFYYSIVRADGFNSQEWAARKAEKLATAFTNAEQKSNEYYHRSHEMVENIPLGQPILVGHYSEKGHRRLLDKSWAAMGKSVEFSDKAKEYEDRIEYWQSRANAINLSMPESIEFYEFELERAKVKHEGLKNGTIERTHSFSLTYAKKEVNEVEKKLKLARQLWG
jgi:hypothetical protein